MTGMLVFISASLLLAMGLAAPVQAQQTMVTLPSHRINDGFFERIGVGWHWESTRPGRQMFFNYPGLNSAVPFFGGWDPGTDARFGFAGRKGNTRFGFNMALQQGNSRTMMSSAPSVMIPNGGSGWISSTTLRPFVTGWIPVVGQQAYSPWRAPIARPAWLNERTISQVRRSASRASTTREEAPLRLSSAPPPTNSTITTATEGASSLSEIRRQQLLVDEARLQQVEELMERARGAEAAGKLGVARIYYQQAANRSSGELKRLLLERERELKRRKAASQNPGGLPMDPADLP